MTLVQVNNGSAQLRGESKSKGHSYSPWDKTQALLRSPYIWTSVKMKGS